jgi:hypothetical protein
MAQEPWIAAQLESAPPLGPERRAQVQGLLAGPWSGYARRTRSREWDDPTYAAVVRRITAAKVAYSHVITHDGGGKGRRFWSGTCWDVSLAKAERFSSQYSAWDVAECLQDGNVDVELLPE